VSKSKSQESHQRVVAKQASKSSNTDVAMAEYRRDHEAISKRTAELRAVRLAHEAEHGPRKKAKAGRVAKTAVKGSLSDWVEDQKKTGRES
jgi:hypothetical protein